MKDLFQPNQALEQVLKSKLLEINRTVCEMGRFEAGLEFHARAQERLSRLSFRVWGAWYLIYEMDAWPDSGT